ncbi:MAG: N-acetyltransferase family protein [Oscillospiraceae bacterium]|nr:N-acetyltransferase family protein [Oscillospiraceae bacterium]
MPDVTIRDARLSDAERLVEIYAYYVENTAITFEYETPSISEFQSRMEHTMEKYPYLVIEKNGKALGYAYAGPFSGGRAAYDWSCELTVYIDHKAQKCGYGGEIYLALEEKLKRMGIQNLYACIACTDTEDEYLNNNSAGFHAHMGFKEAGRFRQCGYKFNRWYDMIWMEKIIGEHEERAERVERYNCSK